MKIILTKKEKIIFVVIAGIAILLVMQGFIKDYTMISHNQKVFQSLPKNFREDFLEQYKNRYTIMVDRWMLRFSFWGRNSGRFNEDSEAPYSYQHLNKNRVLGITTGSIRIWESRYNYVISKISLAREDGWSIFYASNVEEDKNNDGAYHFYIVRIKSEYNKKKRERIFDTDNAVLCKYKIEHATTLLCEAEYSITLPKEIFLHYTDDPLPFLFKEHNEKTIFYIPAHTSYAAPYDVFQFDLQGTMTESNIKGIDCLVLNSSKDTDVYYAKKNGDRYVVFKNESSFIEFEDKVLYGRFLSTGELYILKGYKDKKSEYAFNLIQSGTFLDPRGYIYTPSSDSIRPLYFFSYKWYASNELPSIFLRGFCYFYVINLIPYR